MIAAPETSPNQVSKIHDRRIGSPGAVDAVAVSLEVLPVVAVVTPHGNLTAGSVGPLRDALERAVAERHTVLLDLAGVHTVDAATLGVVVRAYQRAKHRGGGLHLAAPSRFVLTVLHTMRLHTTFATFDSRGQALMSLQRRASYEAGNP
ncbi:STAS domain-containing protein [Rhizomonospora bruguierae]|uniref:STAS domain-containing protein n=1 Tax=Rhizomonospora bruguierae TaxID=1581705 RepID=UPI001BCF90E5|nr:STAS domain-containing protein [Micromonospora sp. NBRC 107566]